MSAGDGCANSLTDDNLTTGTTAIRAGLGNGHSLPGDLAQTIAHQRTWRDGTWKALTTTKAR